MQRRKVAFIGQRILTQRENAHIAHAAEADKVEFTEKKLREALPGAVIEVVDLSPAFITQGGPGCMAIQYVEL